jgi:hypothetical protein
MVVESRALSDAGDGLALHRETEMTVNQQQHDREHDRPEPQHGFYPWTKFALRRVPPVPENNRKEPATFGQRTNLPLIARVGGVWWEICKRLDYCRYFHMRLPCIGPGHPSGPKPVGI